MSSGIYPHPSASATDFKNGDQVKWFVSEAEISPYVGKVTQVCPATNKVWVEFPIGGNQQKDPTELILVTPFMGKSPVSEDTGYSSYEINKAVDAEAGTLRDKVRKLAQDMVGRRVEAAYRNNNIQKMASEIAYDFAENVVDKLAVDVMACIEKKMSDIQTYQHLYPRYETICSDGFMRMAISKIYEVKSE